MTVERTVPLQVEESARLAGTHGHRSAVRSGGAVLRAASHETASIERLVADDPEEPHRCARQAGVRLADLVPLPVVDEADAADEATGQPDRRLLVRWASRFSAAAAGPGPDGRGWPATTVTSPLSKAWVP